MPRAPDPGAKTNLRGVAAHAARWGGAGRTAGIGFLRSPFPCSEPPSNPPALGLGFDAWGHSRETRELAGAVGEGATPCTDGRPSENTPAWIASHQSSLPNAAKGYSTSRTSRGAFGARGPSLIRSVPGRRSCRRGMSRSNGTVQPNMPSRFETAGGAGRSKPVGRGRHGWLQVRQSARPLTWCCRCIG